MASSPFLSMNSARFARRKLGREEAARTRERVAKTVYFIFGRNQAVYGGKEGGSCRTPGHSHQCDPGSQEGCGRGRAETGGNHQTRMRNQAYVYQSYAPFLVNANIRRLSLVTTSGTEPGQCIQTLHARRAQDVERELAGLCTICDDALVERERGISDLDLRRA